jgi:hypothetical protein
MSAALIIRTASRLLQRAMGLERVKAARYLAKATRQG